jgi:hypothetical protein
MREGRRRSSSTIWKVDGESKKHGREERNTKGIDRG